jgi:quinolinate synthase
MFKPAQIENFRKQVPEGKVISHPESSYEVCQLSDYVGSTEYIINTIRDSAPGTQWLVGTELNLVNRLHQQMKAENKTVKFMSPTVCMCSTMFRIDPQHLAWVLENLVENNVVNRITVPVRVANSARIALQRMLQISV